MIFLWRNSFEVTIVAKPDSPQGRKFLGPVLEVSSEGPFTSPHGTLKPSPKRKCERKCNAKPPALHKDNDFPDIVLVHNGRPEPDGHYFATSK